MPIALEAISKACPFTLPPNNKFPETKEQNQTHCFNLQGHKNPAGLSVGWVSFLSLGLEK